MSTIRSSSSQDRARLRPGRVLFVALAAALLAAAGCAKEETAGKAAQAGQIGTAAPAYALPNLDGKTVKNTDFLGKVVILDFWATWCPPCRMEVPHFNRLQAEYRDQGLEIVGLSLDAGGARDVRPFVEEYKVNYTMLLATDETSQSYGGVVGIPTTFVIDRKGTIVKKFVGFTPPEVFEETIKPLLAAS
jgi:peroxiredoxin